MKCTGKAVKYGDNVDTDVIIPARYLNTSDPRELAAHCMEDIDKSFHDKIAPGDILVEGLVDVLSEGDTVEADLDAGVIKDLTTGKSFKTEPFPAFIQNIISAGGLVEAAKKGIIA